MVRLTCAGLAFEHQRLHGQSGGRAAQRGARGGDIFHLAGDHRGELHVGLADRKARFKPFVFEQAEFIGQVVIQKGQALGRHGDADGFGTRAIRAKKQRKAKGER